MASWCGGGEEDLGLDEREQVELVAFWLAGGHRDVLHNGEGGVC